MEMQYKTIEKLYMDDAEMLFKKCVVKCMKALAEGQKICEGKVELEHFVEAVEVGRYMERVDLDKGLEKVVIDKKDVEEKVKQFREMQACGETIRLPSFRVNLAGRSAWNLHGQCLKYLWEKHATMMVDQQRKIISRVKQGELQVLGVCTREAVKNIHELNLYRKYRQVLKDILRAEKVAIQGNVAVDKYKELVGFLFLYRSSSTRRDPGVYQAVLREHMLCHFRKKMATSLFLGQ